MCVGVLPREANTLGRLLQAIAAIVPDVDRLTGPVLEKGELGNASVPKLAFEANELKNMQIFNSFMIITISQSVYFLISSYKKEVLQP